MCAGPWSDRATCTYCVRRLVFECGTVLLIAVRTAVTRWQPGTLRDDQGGSPLNSQEHATLASGPRSAPRPDPALCCWCQVILGVVVIAVVSSPLDTALLPVTLCPAKLLDVAVGFGVSDDLARWGSCGIPSAWRSPPRHPRFFR